MTKQSDLTHLLETANEEEAEHIAREMLEQDPKNVEFLRIAAIEQKGDFETSTAVLRELIRFNPQDNETHITLAGIYFLMGEYNLVENECKTILSIDPNSAAAYGMLGSVAESVRDDPKVIEELYSRAAELEPSVWHHHANLARMYRINNKIDDAIAEVKRALACPDILPRDRQQMEREITELVRKRST